MEENMMEKNKVYFKCIDSDDEYKELNGVIEPENVNIESDEIKLSGKNLLETGIEIKVEINKKSLQKLLRVNILKSKRFKKLLMSVGFGRNEAEKIDNFYKYNNTPRYEYAIDIYSGNIKVIKDFLKGI